MGKALKKQEIIENGSARGVIMESAIRYSTLSEIELRNIFARMVAEEKILPCKYTDNEWILTGRLKDKYQYIEFEGLSKDIRNKIKAYTLCLLDKNESESTGTYVSMIIDVVDITDVFSSSTTEVLEYLRNKEIGESTYSAFLDFLTFIEIDDSETRVFKEALSENITKVSVRTLPCFQSVMAFDDIINKLLKNDFETVKEFYPILLWWKLTMVIPMRPIEFFTLKNTSFYQKEKRYYIKIERSLKSDPTNKKNHPIGLVTDFQITKQLYDLFQSYINIVELKDAGYIFNSSEHNFKYDREFVGRGIFNYNLNKFYDKIVKEKYGFTVLEKETKQFLDEKEIEKINFGDTRHLSFLNLIISGYNPYTIAQLGGHRELSSQMSYYSGATSYCTSKAFSFALGIDNLDVHTMPIAEWRQNQIMMTSTDLSKAIEIDGGYCTCPNFPYECYTATCRSGKCKYFVNPDGSILVNEIKEVEDDISRKVELLRLMIYKEPNDCVERAEIIGALKDQILALGRLYKNKINNGGK